MAGAGEKLTDQNWMDEMFRIAIDQNNSAELWWDQVYAGALETAPKEIYPLLQIGGPTEVVVTDISTIMAWAQNIPGWSDPGAPRHASHPLYVEWMEA